MMKIMMMKKNMLIKNKVGDIYFLFVVFNLAIWKL